MKEKIKNIIKTGISLLWHGYYTMAWKLGGGKAPENCLNKTPRETPVVVTLTSFPGRIHLVGHTLRTILNQKSLRPDGVELWLAESQFPNKEADLPEKLLALKACGLAICWCEDTRSYKKLIPALLKHPDKILVTADDDVYYRRDWLEKLYAGYEKEPTCVSCHRATKFYLKNGEFATIGGGRHFYPTPSYRNKLVGIGGVLYPVGILCPEVTDAEKFTALAPTNDDIWFWFMAIRNDVKIHVVADHFPRPVAVFGAERTATLTSVNDRGEKKFWQQFDKLLTHYPDVEEKLRGEAEGF